METRRTALGLGACLLALALGATGCASASPQASGSPVTRWAEQTAVRIPDDPAGPGPDLAAIADATAGAEVIGLGEPGHTIGEVTAVQTRYLRHLVEHGQVRAVAFEMDWSLALAVDDYVAGLRDDIGAVLAAQEGIWRTAEIRDLLEWLRDHNDAHDDDVRVAGTEYFATGPVAYDTVRDHVAAEGPDRLAEAQAHLDLLRPADGNIGLHLRTYMQVEDKAPYVAAAAALDTLVGSIGGGAGHDVAAHAARQIHAWYEGFSLPWDDIPGYRDARSAENVRWWQRHTGARTVYWAASAHVADAPDLTLTEPEAPDTVFAAAGSYLEEWYGPGYATVGFTFDHGTYRTEEGGTVEMPPAFADWFERPLADVAAGRFVLRLDGDVPPAVRDWLDAPLVTRGRPEHGGASVARGGTLREWFDVLVHTQEVSPAHPL